jgi:glycosyltransferase involved in cell wall biosynthesis
MWDQAQGYTQEWWNSLPKDLRIVAFSNAVYKKASTAGLPVLRLNYFKDPKCFKPASWVQGRTLFYWNRTGMVSPDFVSKLCKYLDINTLLFKPEIDPRIEANKYFELPERIGCTKVVTIKTTASREEFYRLTESANIFLAPRLTEGVGMVFLEALARGCAVVAHDAPTMNEYITNLQNGVLLTNNYRSVPDKLRSLVGHLYTSATPFLLSDNQPWTKLGRLNYEQLGSQARLDHEAGYKNWLKMSDDFASFILKW